MQTGQVTSPLRLIRRLSPLPLDGLRVLELGTFVAAPYCGKLFAGYGADVIKVEPPGGDIARAHLPFKDGRPNRETSAFLLYLNTAKRSAAIDVRTPAGRDAFLRLVERPVPGGLAFLLK